jgi:chromosome segregation ATPase
MARILLKAMDREELLTCVIELKKKLDKKKSDLVKIKSKLSAAQSKLEKMKATIHFQRHRILELHKRNVDDMREKSDLNS